MNLFQTPGVRAALFALGCFCLVGTAQPARASSVAVLGASAYNADVQAKIAGTGLFTTVDIIAVASSTPTLATLQGYAAVLVYSDTTFADPTQLGNVLADYVDAGGGVVVAVFAFYSPSSAYRIEGRFASGGYLPLALGDFVQGTPESLVPVLPGHPILAGVSSFSGGSSSFHHITSLATGATLVANWSGDGQPLVAVKGHVVGLNFFPPSSDALANFWTASTNGALLLANSLFFAALHQPCDAFIAANPGVNIITGTDGNDNLAGRSDMKNVLVGKGGNDILTAGPLGDCLDGGEGNDHLIGGNGADLLFGGNGTDWLEGKGGNDQLSGGAGTDRLDGGAASDTCTDDASGNQYISCEVINH